MGKGSSESERQSTLQKVQLLESDIHTEMDDLGTNLWGLFNGVTKYTIHHMKSRSKDETAIFDRRGQINDKVYSKFISLVQV